MVVSEPVCGSCGASLVAVFRLVRASASGCWGPEPCGRARPCPVSVMASPGCVCLSLASPVLRGQRHFVCSGSGGGVSAACLRSSSTLFPVHCVDAGSVPVGSSHQTASIVDSVELVLLRLAPDGGPVAAACRGNELRGDGRSHLADGGLPPAPGNELRGAGRWSLCPSGNERSRETVAVSILGGVSRSGEWGRSVRQPQWPSPSIAVVGARHARATVVPVASASRCPQGSL